MSGFTTGRRLAVATAVGFLAAASAAFLFDRQEKRFRSRFVTTTVVRAKRYIAAGKPVGADSVDIADIPVAYLPPTAVQRLDELDGRNGTPRWRARVGLIKGEAVTRSKLRDEGAYDGLSWTLAAGETAMAFRFAPEQAVGGFLRPGDRVHVFVCVDGRVAGGRDRARLLAAAVRVAAVGDRLWDPTVEPLAQEIQKQVANDGVFVTLVLTPDQAALLALAADKGRLSLALASPADDGPTVRAIADIRRLGDVP